MLKIDKKRTREFTQRVLRFGFKQTELAVLFKRTARCISFYLCGERNIPTAIWVRLEELEETPRGELCRLVVKGRKKN